MIPLDDRLTGYHFVLNFVPNWPELAEKAAARARAIGVEIPESGEQMQPRFQALTFSGTGWTGLRAGELRYDVLGYRQDLGGSVVTTTRRHTLGIQRTRLACHRPGSVPPTDHSC